MERRNRILDVEKRYRRKDGSFLWVRTSTALVRDGSTMECSVEYVRDITQRKEMSAALIQQQTLLETVLIDLPVALLVCDAAGNTAPLQPSRGRAPVASSRPESSTPGASAAYPLAVDVYLADGVTPVLRENRPLARALRGETISNLELVVAPRDAAAPRSPPVERSPTRRSGRPNPGRGGGRWFGTLRNSNTGNWNWSACTRS